MIGYQHKIVLYCQCMTIKLKDNPTFNYNYYLFTAPISCGYKQVINEIIANWADIGHWRFFYDVFG